MGCAFVPTGQNPASSRSGQDPASGQSGWPASVWPVLEAVFFAAGLWLAGPQPVAMAGGLYDDYLFVRLAHFLLRGEWLGPFDALTLTKGPFYPMVLAACAACGVPVQVAVQCVYLCGALLLARVAGTLAGQRGTATLCFALLAVNPACYDWSTTVLMREPLYGGLLLLVLALGARSFLLPGSAWWPVLLGLAGAAFWLTREEGVLLVPPLLLLAGRHVFAGRADFRRALARPIIAWVTAAALVLSVCAVNRHAYGVFRTNDFRSGPFEHAYGALARIRTDVWRRARADPAPGSPGRLCGEPGGGPSCSPIWRAMRRV